VIVSIDLADTKRFADAAAAAGSQIKIILLNVNSERCEHLLLGFLLKVVTAKVQQHFTRKSAARHRRFSDVSSSVVHVLQAELN